jgi:hypothetical protein
MEDAEKDALQHRLNELESEVKIMKATSGTVRLGTGWVTMAWSICAGLVGISFFIAQLAAAQASLTETVKILASEVKLHEGSPGHPVALERTQDLNRRVEKIEEQLGR